MLYFPIIVYLGKFSLPRMYMAGTVSVLILFLFPGTILYSAKTYVATVLLIRRYCDWSMCVIDTSCMRQDRPCAHEVLFLTAAYCTLPHGKLYCDFHRGFSIKKKLFHEYEKEKE